MNFELNEQQLSIQKMAREFTEKKVAPKVLERDETRVYDVELYQELSRMGFIGLPYAKEYGGQGLGYLEYAIAIEEISKVDPSLSVAFSVATSLYGGSLYFSEATDEQLKRFMPPVIRDGHLGSFGLTEPTAGSDVSGMLTFAERKGDEYIINGSKCFITNGPLSDYFCVYALTTNWAPRAWPPSWWKRTPRVSPSVPGITPWASAVPWSASCTSTTFTFLSPTW